MGSRIARKWEDWNGRRSEGETCCSADFAGEGDSAAKLVRPAPVAVMGAHAVLAGSVRAMADVVAEERPVALVYNDISHVVMMATPVGLEDFALGFSLSEGILENPQELLGIDTDEAPQGLIVRLTISARRFAALKGRRRGLAGRTGCGLCGVDSLEQAVRPVHLLSREHVIAADAIRRALDVLPGRQTLNLVTHSLHAAAWADVDGKILLVREDVGRHNALDKLIGGLAGREIDFASGFALITSRCSYEMVQKAAAAGIPALVAISAPTALAVRMADAANLTMIALARADGMRVYSHPEFIDGIPPSTEFTSAE